MSKRLRLILAATDFSRSGGIALARAAQLARESSARLVLLHVIDVGGSALFRAGAQALGRELRSQVERHLGQAAAGIRRSHGVRVSIAIERGVAADRIARGYVPAQILRMAADLRQGLVAMGAYGHTALAATLLGSVSAHVAAEAPCDVLLVKAPAARPKRRRARRRAPI